MRKVKFTRKPTKIQFTPAEDQEDGFFHEWGLDIATCEDTAVSYTVAIIEDLKGHIELVGALSFKFINKEEN